MPSVQKERTVEQSPQACFDALQALLPDLGYEIWKTRPMAYLTQARGSIDGAPLTLNIIASMFAPTRVTVTAASDDLPEDALNTAAETILQRLATP
jgi:hypothetical protein